MSIVITRQVSPPLAECELIHIAPADRPKSGLPATSSNIAFIHILDIISA
ncbi:MAG: hypothetical protein ACP5QU_02390 [Anaerolineae bacterium]